MKHRVSLNYANEKESIIQGLQRDLPQLNGVEEDAARYGIALGQLYNGQFVEATQSLGPLLKKDSTRITYVMLEADIAREAEQFEKALGILEKNLRINPNNHPLTMSYAKTLEANGRYLESAEVLEGQALIRPNDPELWFQLAEIQGKADQINKVHQARGEYFITIGDFTRARNQFNLALNLEKDRLIKAKIQQRLDYIRDLQNRYYR